MEDLLTPAWLDELGAALVAAEPVESPGRIALGQVVTGAPDGDVAYTLLFGGGQPASLVHGVEGAVVTVVEPYETATDIASGTPAAGVLANGKVKVRGDVRVLLDSQEALADLAEAVARARLATNRGISPQEEFP